jgi:FAD/FMN-containing dehydrogenase
MAILDDKLLGLGPFAGELLRPGNEAYNQVRRIHNGMIDKRPALILRCRRPDDVASAVDFARNHSFEISVRGGGHNVAGKAITDGGVMIDLALMRGIDVDPTNRTVRAQGGATWGELDREAQLHGLALTGGMVSTTGIAGLTLGGGIGWLMGRHGLSIDNLLSAEVVTAEGRVLTASAEENEDLFWALRGGGGNFGVVSSFEYRLHPVGPIVTGIRVAYPFSAAGDLLRFYRTFTAGSHDDLTLNAALVHAPDASATQLAVVVGCHVGAPEQSERDLEPLRRFGSPVEAVIGPMEYTAINSIIDPAYPRGFLNYWKSSFLRDLSDAAIDEMVAQFAACPSTRSAFVIENLHGAVTRVPPEATAFPNREPGYNFLITSVWLDPAKSEENVAWTRSALAAMRPFTTPRRYVNYIAEDEVGEDPVREAYGPNYARLVELKNRYDPANLFRLNQNIKPSGRS